MQKSLRKLIEAFRESMKSLRYRSNSEGFARFLKDFIAIKNSIDFLSDFMTFLNGLQRFLEVFIDTIKEPHSTTVASSFSGHPNTESTLSVELGQY